MDKTTQDMLEEVQKLFDCANQSWLFGAGISYESNIPLMYPLTERVEELINKSKKKESIKIYKAIKGQLMSTAHIEHFLSHIGDLLALIERSDKEKIKIDSVEYTKDSLEMLYKDIISNIGDIVRYGYSKSKHHSEQVGTISNPIVDIENHRGFVRAILKISKEKISNINFFTTNYDTLLEDALVLEHQDVEDGFLGTAVGFWNPDVAYNILKERKSHKIYKLHGSIDWYYDDKKELIRCRYGTKYLSDTHNLLIYPQATKYVETQKDPFAYLFAKFRDSFNQQSNNILIVNGYSFGDNHINNEIESAMIQSKNKTTLIIFIRETQDDKSKNYSLPTILQRWMLDGRLNARIHILSNRGIYNGDIKSILSESEKDYDWWTFTGMVDKILLGGTV